MTVNNLQDLCVTGGAGRGLPESLIMVKKQIERIPENISFTKLHSNT